MAFRCLPARNDRFQKNFRFSFDKRNQIDIIHNLKGKHPLSGVLCLIGMFKNFQNFAPFNVAYNVLKRNTALSDKLLILFSIPSNVFHSGTVYDNVCLLATIFPKTATGCMAYLQLYLNEFAFIRNLKHFDILELIKEKQEAKTARNQGRGQEQRPKATANQGPSKKPKASASERAPAVRGLKKGMYSRGDLNPHAVKHTHLKRTCLPIPPPERVFRLKAACAAFRQN